MAEFSRTTYDFNSRIVLNDTSTDTTKYVLLNIPNITDTLADNVEETRPEESGMIDFGTHLGKGQWIVPVTLYASTLANMAQLVQNFKEAFNPDLLEADATYGEATAYNGYHPLDWTETVGANSRDFRLYVKSQEIPVVPADSMSGLIREATIKLKLRDPRKYLQAQSTITDSDTAANAGTYTTPVTITITASGATSTSLEIENTTTSESIYVDTALSNGEVLVIDTFAHTAKLDGTDKRSYIGSSTKWWYLDPGNNTITVKNGTNCSVSTAWRSAWEI